MYFKNFVLRTAFHIAIHFLLHLLIGFNPIFIYAIFPIDLVMISGWLFEWLEFVCKTYEVILNRIIREKKSKRYF